MPATKDTRRRHSKKPSTSRKNAPPPSEVSTVSSSSASSNATITSRSLFPSSLRPSKRPDAISIPPERPSLNHARSHSKSSSNEKSVDVFAYMMEEGEEEEEEYQQDGSKDMGGHNDHGESLPPTSSPPSARLAERPQQSPRYSDLEVRTIQDNRQRSWGRESLHSDSGISDMRSSSPDQESPLLHKKLPTLPDEPWAEVDGQDAQYSYAGTYGIQDSPDLARGRRSSAFHHKHWPSMETTHSQGPEPYYVPSPSRLTNHSHEHMQELYPRPSNQLVRGISQDLVPRSKSSSTGYDLLASQIDSRDDSKLRPIYRKFETLNNRMLLYLQDEICEMEDQLKELDDAIAHEERNNLEKRTSRRAEAKLPSQLQWHRLDLLNRSFAKVEQYNRALTSYNTLTKTLDPASHSDIAAYRTWLSAHAPIDDKESAFIHQDADLLRITRNSTSSSNSPRSSSALETPIVLFAFALLAMTVVFKVVSQILGRLVLSGLVGVAALCALNPEVMTSWRCLREWGRGIATYSAIMMVLAVVVS